jgi:hypothetical protein
MNRKIWYLYYAPPSDSGGSAVLDKPGPKEEFLDDDTHLLDGLLGDKEDKEDDKEEKEDEEDKEDLLEEDKEEKEDEDEEEEKEDLLDVTNARGVDLKKIKEKYPDFAKTNDFRELRNAYYRESQYTEIFPTLEDAHEAAENNETFNKLNEALVQKGDATDLLRAVNEASPEAYKKLATGFLDTVAKLDNNTYVEMITPVVKRLARQIYDAGNKILKRNDKDESGQALVATARNIMQYAFEDGDAIDKPDQPVDPKIAEKEAELNRRESAIAQEKYNSAYSTCSTAVERHLDKMILQGLDPDGKMNEFTRDTLLEKIKDEVKSQVGKDQTHLKRMTSLWKRSAQQGFNRESLSSIVSAFLERARPVIPTVRNKFRSKAITQREARNDDDNSDKKNIKLVNKGRTGRSPSNDGKVNMKNVDPRKIDYRNTSDDDIFEGKIKLKG